MTKPVPQDLRLNMTQGGNTFFDIDITIAKSAFGFSRNLMELLMKLLRSRHLNNTLAPATMNRF